MSVKKRLLPALVSSALALSATGADAVTFNGVYVFGDSLSDSGYFRPFLAAAGVPSSLVSTLGRFTTNPGPVWSELIATNYGGNPNPSNAGGGIYAQGGARVAVSSTSTPPGSAQRPISTQIDEYLSANSGRADPGALYAIWGGANDIFQAGAAGVTPAATAEIQQIARLQGAGAKYILAFSLPNLGLTPASQAGGAAGVAQGTAASVGYNTLLFNGIAQNNLKVIPVDTFTLLNEIVGNASAYGFTNTSGIACGAFPPFTTAATASSQFCYSGNLVSANAASTYVFADSVHPTTAAHALLADYVKSLIDGPNAYSTMAEVPLAARAAHIRALDEGLVSGNRAAIGNLAVFAAGDNGKFDMSTTKLNPQTDSKNRTAAVGITFRASEGATIGFAVGKTTTDANMGSVGKFETNENVMSAFGSFKTGNWYMNFTGSVADLKFDNVTRYVKLGPVTRTNSSNTNGTNTSGSVTAGYDFAFGSASVGPFASYTSQSVSVSGFSENASANTPASTDLKISAQDRSSRVLGVGVRGSIKVGNWTPFARVSYDTENANRDRFVTATPMSIAQNLSYDIPAYKSGKRWVTSTLGVRGLITDHISASLVYTTVSSRSDIKQDGVTGSVAFAF